MKKKIYAIADLHLSFQVDKPMNVFGENWDGYEEKILSSWNANLGEQDIGVIAGDISWAMKMEQAEQDFLYLKKLNGKKIIIRGNHDYWWKSVTRIREKLAPDIYVLQSDSIRLDGIVFAGTRLWKVAERNRTLKAEDKKIFETEVIRLELALKDAHAKMKEGDKLVAVVHFPPFNAARDDSEYTKLMEKYKVDICIYGHLHGKPWRADLVTHKNGIVYYLTSCDMLGHEVAHIEI